MTCEQCGRSNLDGASFCAGCGTRIAPATDRTVTHLAVSTPSKGSDPFAPTVTGMPGAPAADAALRTRLAPGARLGERYEIMAVLGEGGMGTVYKARDHALGRDVAIKVIRTDMASRPEILERFKREILLASQVTHRNVLRIYDLGEADGIHFLSMNYVEGTDLKSQLRQQGPLALDSALPLASQIVDALQAAHEAGIVHRDLKPQNVLIDGAGQAYIADFGISRSIESGATMTETGMILGTLDYMSPEQARGETPDHRGDLYAFGVMLYEMLTGQLPFRSDNPLSMMMKRVHEDAPGLRLARPDLPAWIAAIVARSMERDPASRYQAAAEIGRDLGRRRATVGWRRLTRPRLLVPAAAILVAGLAGLLIWRGGITVSHGGGAVAAALPKASLAVLPFQNATGDPRYDWVRAGLPDLLRADLLQAHDLRLAGEDRIKPILDALRAGPGEEASPVNLARITSLLDVESVLVGRVLKAGERIRIEASLRRAGSAEGDPGLALRAEGASDDAIFAMVDDLTRQARAGLGVGAGLFESRHRASDLSTRSVDALKLYGEGLALSRAGNQQEAAKRLEAALEKDPKFAVARALLAETYDQLGYSDRARSEADKAVQGLGSTSPYEAARIRAIRARLGDDLDAAEAAYRALCASSPGNAGAWFDLAAVQEEKGDLKGSMASLTRVLALDPKHPSGRYALGRVQFKLGNPAGALGEFNTALSLQIESGNEEGRATALNAIGNAENALGRSDEALRHFQDALAIRERIGDRRGVGATLDNIAKIHSLLGHTEQAIRFMEDAIKVSREISDRAGLADRYANLGDIYGDSGRPEEALASYQESLKIVREIGDAVSEARNLSNVGYVNSVLGRYLESFFFLKEALAKRRQLGDKLEIGRSLNDLAIVEQVQGRYDEAEKYNLEGIALAKEIGSRTPAVILTANLAAIHDDQGHYASALSLLEEAEAGARQTADQTNIASCLIILGSTRRHLGDYAGAAAALDEGLRLARASENRSLLAEALAGQGALALDRGQREQAVSLSRQALGAAREAHDHRLVLQARLRLAEASSSASDLETTLKDLESSGLLPLLAPGRLALSRIESGMGRAAPALRQAELALRAAEPLHQNDLLLQAHGMASACLRKLGRRAEADAHDRTALETLGTLRDGLRDDALARLERRPDIIALTRSGEAAAAGSSPVGPAHRDH